MDTMAAAYHKELKKLVENHPVDKAISRAMFLKYMDKAWRLVVDSK